jgi:polyribonucleotide nucleotidyltransferase
MVTPIKQEREKAVGELRKSVYQTMLEQYPDLGEPLFNLMFEEIQREVVRAYMKSTRKRVDGRSFDEIRPLYAESGVLPRVHGSGLFIRGQTQVMSTVTLGSFSDVQFIDAIGLEEFKRFMHKYDFPPVSTGELKPRRGPSRREIGHGALVERALSYLIPSEEDFPYTIRVVSEVLESNGSTSMASTCASSIALMNAGVPIARHVGGIAMGLIEYDDENIVLTDIQGLEDHLGDMDFKVAGTRKGITAFQMDTKIKGVDAEILRKALLQAKEGRLHILDIMERSIQGPREEISLYAPRIVTLQIKPEKIREVIGPGGKMIKHIVDKTKAKIFIDDSGTVNIASVDKEACDEAIRMIQEIVREPEVGQVYMGKVKSVVDFGAFVEIMPGIVGLLHISQISNERVHNIHDRLKEGDELLVKVLEVDRGGKIRLSHKEAQETP